MPDITKYSQINASRRIMWATEGEMDKELTRNGSTPCLRRERLYDAAHASFVARWATRTICEQCPLSGETGVCLQAGKEGRETGVWGGYYSSSGKEWLPIKPAKQNDIIRALQQSIGTSRGIGMIRAVARIVPGVGDLFLVDGRMRFTTIKGQQCIIRDARQSLLPDGSKGSIRAYIMTDLLGIIADDCQVAVHATCSSEGCIAPWHLRWELAPQGMSRSIALGLYTYFSRKWKVPQASEASGVSPRDLREYIALASMFESDWALPEPAIGAMIKDFTHLRRRPPTARETTMLTRFCIAADDLDCDTVTDLISAGESEF